MKIFTKKNAIIFISLFVFSTTIFSAPDKSGFLYNLRELKEISDIIDIIQENHVNDKDITKKDLLQGAIKGMMNSLDDPHSSYLTEKELTDFREDLKGKYVGVGMVIQKKENEPLLVVSPVEDSPAYKAGIKPKDKILEIDGESVYKFTSDECAKKLKGKKNTKVKIKLYRESNNMTKEIELVREEITLKYVKHRMLSNSIGYLRITQFGENIYEDAKSAINDMKQNGMKALILDLRSNPGGEIQQSVKIASLFIKEGKIVSTKEKSGRERNYMREGDYMGDFPLAVLVNGGSASASEIVSGAILDYKRGTLVGEKTFGKGSVQSLIPLPDGDAIKLTIAKYYTPNGSMIHGKGINPNVVVEDKDYYLISDSSIITNIDETKNKEDKKELIKQLKGNKVANSVDTHKDIQLEKAKNILLDEMKKKGIK